MECPSCRADLPEGSKFCIRCGEPTAHGCPSCGNQNPPGSRFCAQCGTRLRDDEALPKPTISSPAPLSTAERRHLTVMFCDLVGSTALSALLDVEDLRDLIGAFQGAVATTISQFGGYLARYMGDGALVYFGYPQAQEDDPEQAIRAALALIAATKQLPGPEPLQVRIGIATGLAVVGHLLDAGELQEREVVGEVPNLAARLQAVAAPNTVVIAEGTRQLIGSVFELEDLGTQILKGFSAPQHFWRVLGPSAVMSRFEAFHSVQAPLVGREEELALLLRRWEQAKAGEGRAVLLSAEPGVGKSRLVVALQEKLGNEPHFPLRYFCSAHSQESALFPVIAQLERAAGFRRDDSTAKKLDKLETLTKSHAKSDDEISLLAELLLLPRNDAQIGELSHQQKKERTFRAFIHQLEGLAQQRPVLMVFEDLHWSDSTSRELIHETIRRISTLPILLIGTFRPDFQLGWSRQPHVTTLTLSRLSQREGEALVTQLASTIGKLPNDLLHEIVERADGVPLFLEEVTKAVLENGGDTSQARGLVARVPRSRISVPPTLHASLMARLDRLGDAAKELLQIGATIGREFSYELLLHVAGKPEEHVRPHVKRLVEAGLVFLYGSPPQADLQFKHALVQDAAYGTLLRGPRQQLHAKISQALEAHFVNYAQSRPELLAHHLTEAGLRDRALRYWQLAGEVALRRSAAGEAVKHFTRALHVIDELKGPPAGDKLGTLLGLGTALSICRGSAHPEVAETYSQAVGLGRNLGDSTQLFRALWGSWYCAHLTGETTRALALAEELVSLAERLGEEELMLEGYHSRWATSHTLGLNHATLSDTEKGIQLYNAQRHHGHVYRYGGHDTGVCARAHNAMTLWITGFPDRAAAMTESALALGKRLGHPPSFVHAAWWSATVWQELRAPKRSRELAELAIRLSEEQGSQIFVMCPLLIGWSVFESNGRDEGLRLMENAITRSRERGRRWYFDYELLVYAEALLQADVPERALPIIEEALQIIDGTRNRLFMAEACRLKGLALVSRRGSEVNAETWMQRALETAEQQGALSFRLRAGVALARDLQKRTLRDEARQLLAPIYANFQEGFETPELRSAEGLLKLLSE
jgi:class 3 adenylate cyclase